MKTGCVALVLCLNTSVDPPDVIKISPCARMECWIGPTFSVFLNLLPLLLAFVSRNHFSLLLFDLTSDPFSMSPPRALQTIGHNLSTQYERWLPKVITSIPPPFLVAFLCLLPLLL